MKRSLTIHLLCWGLVFCLPLLFNAPGDVGWNVSINRWIRSLGGPVVYMILFYLNYFILIPRFYFAERKTTFYTLNIIAVIIATGAIAEWWILINQVLSDQSVPPPPHKGPKPFFHPRLFYNSISCVLVVGLSLAVSLSQRWQHIEQARKDAEQSRTEAELSNLRNQLNPHFLLNTLNNIYALIAFDSDKAQQAVTDLSRLLRHVLYDNRQTFVPLCKEADFIRNYIELMRIRVTANVKIDTRIDVSHDDATPIAPLIFISLIENAFKHGIAPDGSGFISIALTQRDGTVTCEIRNSNHPKRQNDKSGSGIGLEQVERRLQLLYPEHHSYTHGTAEDNSVYYAIIKIQTQHTELP